MASFAVLIYAPDSIHTRDATADELKECNDDFESLHASGRMTLAYALLPKEDAVTVTADGHTAGVRSTQGDIVAGFYVIEADDIEHAVLLARHNPAVATGGAVEIRPVHSGGVLSQDQSGASSN